MPRVGVDPKAVTRGNRVKTAQALRLPVFSLSVQTVQTVDDSSPGRAIQPRCVRWKMTWADHDGAVSRCSAWRQVALLAAPTMGMRPG